MAIVWMDGFNKYAGIALSDYNSSTQVQSSSYSGRYDGSSVQISDYNSSETARITAGLHNSIPSTTTLSVGIAVSRLGEGSNYPYLMTNSGVPFIMLYNGTPTQVNMIAGCSIYSTNGTSYFGAIQNRSGVVATTNQLPYFNISSWNYLEFEIQTGTTTGQARLYLNGQLILSTSAANFSNSASATAITNVGILPSNYSTRFMYLDDYYITNTSTRLGEIHISTLSPSADTAQKDWTPSTGVSNASLLANNNYSVLTSYVTTTASNKKDMYEVQDLGTTVNTSTILATKVNGIGYKNSFGPSNVNLVMKSNTVEVNGAGTDLYEGTTGVKKIPSIVSEVDPATSAAWTASSINNIQIGIRSN